MQSDTTMASLILLVVFLLPGAVWSQSLDYSDPDNWVPPVTSGKPVDVFYVYPTVSADPSGYMDVTNEEDRQLVLGIFQSQASVFFAHADVYAPYYRQASTGGTGDVDYSLGQQDVKDAFDHYRTVINPDLERPFILAGHSQGSRALKVLISDRFSEDASFAEHLVAAYVIGETITEADLVGTGVAAAQEATDTGVVVSYNTQAPGVAPGPMVSSDEALCINPLNWATDGSYVSSDLHRGAVIYDHETGQIISDPAVVLNFCDAQIDTEGRGLMAEIPAEYTTLDFGPFGAGVYHRYDYDFWYKNLEENAGARIAAFAAQQLDPNGIPTLNLYGVAVMALLILLGATHRLMGL